MSLYKNQKTLKPKIVDVAVEFISGDNLKNLFNFLEFLKDNKLSLRWQSTNSWKVVYKNKSVCYVNLSENKGFWMIRHSHFTREHWFTDYEKYITDDELKNFILDNINPPLCGERNCWGWNKSNITILGKRFDKVCNCWPVTIRNLNGVTLECSKKLILMIKQFIYDLSVVTK